jgi:homoserine dehydrogenase
VPHLAFQPDAVRDVSVLPMAKSSPATTCACAWPTRPACWRVTTILADAGISIDALLQREADEVGGEGSTQTDLIILTHEAREGAMNGALAQMQALPTVLAPIVRIRKEELN